MHSTLLLILSCCLVAVVSSQSSAAQPPQKTGKLLVYVGTYSGPKSRGIYACQLDLASGKCTEPELAAEVKNPSFLAVHPGGELLYSVNEIGDMTGKPTGGVSAFRIDRATGKLTLLNQEASRGAGPCHLIVDRSGRTVLVANYGGGSVAALPISADGKLGPAGSAIQHQGSSVNPARQKEPHAHSINVDPANHFAIAADLGLDKLLVYRLYPASAGLTAHDPPSASVAPGAGPRHFAFHPGGKFAYVINEMACTVTAFAWDGDAGKLTEIQTLSSLPPGQAVEDGFSTAEVQVHPSGKFLYGSNRGHDSISVYQIDPASGKLSYQANAPTGKTPRGFGIDPTGQFLLAGAQGGDKISVFRINQTTGGLEPTGQELEVGSPVCVKFVAAQ